MLNGCHPCGAPLAAGLTAWQGAYSLGSIHSVLCLPAAHAAHLLCWCTLPVCSAHASTCFLPYSCPDRLALPAADCGGSWLADIWSSWRGSAQHPQDCLQDHRGELPAPADLQPEVFCKVSSHTSGCSLRAAKRLCLVWASVRHRHQSGTGIGQAQAVRQEMSCLCTEGAGSAVPRHSAALEGCVAG